MDSQSSTTTRPSMEIAVLVTLTVSFLFTAMYMNFQMRDRLSEVIVSAARQTAAGQTEAASGEQTQTPKTVFGQMASTWAKRDTDLMIQGGLSLVLVLAALFVILSKRYTPTNTHWAYGMIGTIVGFWFGNTH